MPKRSEIVKRATRAALLASALARAGHRAPRRLTATFVAVAIAAARARALLDGAVVAGAVSLPVDLTREEDVRP